jgi:hypothetical protein
MRSIILLSSIVLVALCAAGKAEQFSSTNAVFQAKLLSAAGPLVVVKGTTNDYFKNYREIWEQIDSWPKGDMTNGIFCAVQMFSKTACCAFIANTTTNTVAGYLHLPFEAISEIELFDPQGRPVAKTAADRQISYWTQEQIKDLLKQVNPTTMSRKGYFGIHALFYAQISNEFSISQAFQVKQPGEYTFHLSVRLVKNEQDKVGNFLTTLLPEVVAKVQIRPEDIPPENLPPNVQTNSPTK